MQDRPELQLPLAKHGWRSPPALQQHWDSPESQLTTLNSLAKQANPLLHVPPERHAAVIQALSELRVVPVGFESEGSRVVFYTR